MHEPDIAAREPDSAAKVAFLSNPRAYAIATRAVATVETHMSWVFLTDAHAYKLKKAIRFDGDLRELAAREAQCRNEVVLNRRLTSDVYLGVVPLTLDPAGRLHLDLGGHVVDWLVWMRRLPEASMLDRQIAAGRVDAARLRACIGLLARFYRAQPPEPITAARRREQLAARIAQNADVLRLPRGGLAAGQGDFLARHGAMFERRVAERRIVEGHGDLRPEHLCLADPPQVIDCLDFSRELRIVDPAEELAFLALECERLGAAQLRATILESYGEACGDRPPAALLEFHASLQACSRAKLAVWHEAEPGPVGAGFWRERAREYVRLAALHLDAAELSAKAGGP